MGNIRIAICRVRVFLTGSCLGGNFLGWEFSWVGIIQVGLILGGNFLWWKFSGRELSGENHPGGNFPGGSFHVTLLENVVSPFSQSFLKLYVICIIILF